MTRRLRGPPLRRRDPGKRASVATCNMSAPTEITLGNGLGLRAQAVPDLLIVRRDMAVYR